jgi:hypothetical protein
LYQEIEIQHGLGISVRVRFKNQYVLGRIYPTDPYDKSSAPRPPEYFDQPETHHSVASKKKTAFVASVGVDIIPAGS